MNQPNPNDVPIAEDDVRVDIYRSGLARMENPESWPVVRITHIPTGIVTEGKKRSVLQGKVDAIEQLQQKLNEREQG